MNPETLQKLAAIRDVLTAEADLLRELAFESPPLITTLHTASAQITIGIELIDLFLKRYDFSTEATVPFGENS